MQRLNISKEEVDGLFDTVFDKTFQDARRIWWEVNAEGYVRAQSVYWFYCWAQTGMAHERSRLACREIFNEIFPFTYEFFSGRVPGDYPRSFRHSLRKDDFNDQELDRFLS